MNILLAEDDTTSRDLMRRIIAYEPGHTLVQARDGEEAWQLLRESTPRIDVGVFDVAMPRLDGISLVKRLRASSGFRTLPVILCTAFNDRQTVHRARSLSVDHYIVKPYTRALVVEKLRLVATELATHIVVEDPAIVADRLGIEPALVTELIGSFSGEVRAWLERAGRGRLPEEFRGLAVAANGLRGAALSLGLRALSRELGHVEDMILQRFAVETREQFPPSHLEIVAELDPIVVQLGHLEARTRVAA